MFSALKKSFLPFVLVTGGALFAFLPSAHAEEPLQLTNDDGTQFLNISPDINANGDVIWLRQDKSGFTNSDILFHDGLGIVSLTDSFNGPLGLGYDFSSPKLNDSGLAVWFGTENNSFAENVFLYDGQTINQITSQPTGGGQSLSFNNLKQAVWTGLAGASDNEIFLYNGNSVTQLTDGPLSSSSPALSNSGYVTWVTQNTASGGDFDIYRYFDGSVERITNDAFSDLAPKVNSNGQLAWLTASGPDAGVQFYDGGQITRLSDYNQADPNIFLDLNDAGQVVWNRSGDIFFYDGQQTIQLTNTPDREDKNPYINLSGQAVWESYPVNGVNSQIFLYDGTEVKQIDTDVSFHDRGARISDNGDVVWESALSDPQRPFDQQIFLYDADAGVPPPPPPVETDLSPPQGQLPLLQQPSQSSEIHGLVNLIPENPFDPNKATIVITHGRTGATEEEKAKINPDTKLFEPMTTALEERFGEEGISSYNIAAWKWEDEASSLVNTEKPYFVGPITLFTTGNAVLNVATGEGNDLAKELISKGLTKEVHLIGHSAGGTLISQAAKKFEHDAGKPVGQLTFLDSPLVPYTNITDTSEWADNYPSSSGGEPRIRGAFDYDLRPLTSNFPFPDQHGYAIDFYTKTIDCGGSQEECNLYKDKGFAWSREGGNQNFGTNPDRNSYRNVVDDLPENDFVIGGESTAPTIGITRSETFDGIGNWKRADKPVPFIEGTPLFLENSSAFLFEELTIPSDTTHFGFDFKFDQLGDGDYLTANFNEDLLFWFKGTNFYGDEFWNTSLIDISPYAGQTGTWTFGLNGVGEPNARMRIDNFTFYDVQFSDASGGLPGQNVVPEPSSLVLLGMGLVGGIFCSGRKNRRKLS